MNSFFYLCVLKGKFILKQNPKETRETTFSLGFLQVKIKRDFSCLETDMEQQKKQRKRKKKPKESEEKSKERPITISNIEAEMDIEKSGYPNKETSEKENRQKAMEKALQKSKVGHFSSIFSDFLPLSITDQRAA